MHKNLLALMLGLASVAPAQADDGDTVVASRGGQNLTLREVDARVHEIPENYRAGFMASPDRIEKMLRELLMVEQLAAEAESEGILDDPILAAQLELARKRVLASKRLYQLSNQDAIGDIEVLAREQYQSDPTRFNEAESVEVRHLLVKLDCRSPEEAKKLAEGYRERIASGKDTLESLALKYSEDEGTRSSGGLFMVQPGRTVKPFETAVYALKAPGDLSAVTETEFGFHVIQLVKRHPGTTRTFDQVKAELMSQIEQQRRSQQARTHTETLQNLAIEANPDALATLRTRYGVAPDQDADAPIDPPAESTLPEG